MDISGPQNHMVCYGEEGQAPGLFTRPQGLCTDSRGHLLVCDSKCNRVQVSGGWDVCDGVQHA